MDPCADLGAEPLMTASPERALLDGIVTLVVAQIVESSPEADEPPADPSLADRIVTLLDTRIAQHDGSRPLDRGPDRPTVGAFVRSTDAIACALDVQRALARPPDGRPPTLRIAVHSGQVLVRHPRDDRDPTVSRCARLASLAHGGQILVSDTTRTVLGGADLGEAGFLDLGSHRLDGLDRADHVWQLTHPELDDAFPPLRSHDGPATNLPSALSSFVGREEEVAWLGAQLAEQRLVTVTGAGGSGKTRLAYETAKLERGRFPDGVWCVELAPVGSPGQVALEIARVLGLREELGRPVSDTLVEQLQDFDGLLVVDNCEHVLDGARSTLGPLLQHCARLRVLATSREPLGLDGEATWRVPSLEVDRGSELFVQRARSVRPQFAPDADEASDIVEIVTRLDGIPLAIELAAARIRMMSPAAIAAGLNDRFRLLTGGKRTVLARQQTLEASVAWSYDLLEPAEQLLARRLAVMPQFTLEDAEAIAGDEQFDRYEVLDVLTRLVDKSVVHVDLTRADIAYRFLESVRQFLQGRLVDSGEADLVRVRHLQHFVALAERVEPEIAFRDSAALLAHLEAEHDNLEAALEFADSSGRRAEALRLATSLTLFWELRGHLGRASRWFERLLDQEDDEATARLRGRACWGAAHIGLYGGDIETMTARAPEALELAERHDDDWARARALNTVGFATAVMTPDQARPGLERSIELGLRIGDEWAVLNSRKMVTAAAWATQDEASALRDLEALRRHALAVDAGYFLAWYHGLLGMFLGHRGDLLQARMHLEAAIEMCDGVGEPVTGGMSRAWLWAIDILEGHYEHAERSSAARLQRASASGEGLAIADLLANLGQVSIAHGDAETAVATLGPVYETQREHGIPFMVATLGLVLASARRRAHDLPGCAGLLDELDRLATTLGNRWVGARVDLERSRLALDRGELDDAEPLVHAALTAFRQMGRRPDVVETLNVLGFVAAAAESPAEALRCFAAADAEGARLGMVLSPPDASATASCRAALRVAIGDAAADEHWAEGAGLSLDDVVEYVSRARGERKRPTTGWASLTPTELRVVDLVAEGLTNPQIAEQMFIARGTVKVHVSHIFAKLGLTSRAELAALAARRTEK